MERRFVVAYMQIISFRNYRVTSSPFFVRSDQLANNKSQVGMFLLLGFANIEVPCRHLIVTGLPWRGHEPSLGYFVAIGFRTELADHT